ncbi:PACE efflux transporter [Rheinheimera sp. 4Y26]|uniref:PACE efflux transporter n=1 Tax=Rheinheimera sp. 4Y26 TaxID=2977811 RepID=UPI0021B0ABA6|nr:PACE efflux transporter [Rheinheimera sp. 4Y26]MCT6700944.1 PACE efflux transporter [Rheinheimera sp. 4Y26]
MHSRINAKSAAHHSNDVVAAPPLSRSRKDRLRMALGFEGIGLLLLVPLSSLLFDKSAVTLGLLAVLMSLLATWWNYQFNQWFDRYYLAPKGRSYKTAPERLGHAVLFELGLLAVFVPLTAWYLAVSLWQALLLDLGFMLFYLLYGYLYHWAYDLLFPIPSREAGS